MATKLCFNCFQQIAAADAKCKHCGVLLGDDQSRSVSSDQETRFEEPQKDYDKEMEKLLEATKETAVEESYRMRSIQSDLRLIVITASILGLLQIYSAFLLRQINAIGPLFGADRIVDEWVLLVSGFIYFSSVVLFYYRFFLFRLVFLLINVFHLSLLYLMYDKLQVIRVNLSSDDPLDLPFIVQDFLLNIQTFEWVIIGFGLCYVSQSVFMFKFELLKFSYSRTGRRS